VRLVDYLKRNVNGNVITVHAIKAYRGRRGTAPLIFNLVITWSLSGYFMIRSLYHREITPVPLQQESAWAQSRYERFGQNKIYCPAGIQTPDPPAHIPVAIPTTTARLTLWQRKYVTSVTFNNNPELKYEVVRNREVK
jgi:hypothetical protein